MDVGALLLPLQLFLARAPDPLSLFDHQGVRRFLNLRSEGFGHPDPDLAGGFLGGFPEGLEGSAWIPLQLLVVARAPSTRIVGPVTAFESAIHEAAS